MAVDYTALRVGTLVHGGGMGIVIEPLRADAAKVMSLAPEDIGQVRTWGNGVDVISEPKDDIDAAKLMRAYNVAGLMEPMATVIVKNTEAVWAEYRLQVKVPTRLLGDADELRSEVLERIAGGDFTCLSGPDIRCSIDSFGQEYDIEGVEQ